MKTIYRIIETITSYENINGGLKVKTFNFDWEDFKSNKGALNFLENKYKEFERRNNANTYCYKEFKYERLKEHTWKIYNKEDLEKNGKYDIYNFSIIKLYID